MTREQVTRTVPRKWGPMMAVFAVLLLVGTALAVHNDGYFELDGNATSVADDGVPFGFNDGEDWDKVCPASEPAGAAAGGCLGGSTATAKFWTADDNRIYTGGSSKDDLDVTGWRHTLGSVPDKDELLHGMAARYGDHLYFGADRFANSGDAQMGVWFFQSAVGPITSGANAGKFSGSHLDGDILVLSDFTRGGTQPTIRVFRWNGPGGTIAAPATINGTLDLLAGTTTDIRDCQGATLPINDAFCATVNTGIVASPWAFVPKSGAAGSFQKGEFYEGGIDLAFLNLQDECFSSVILETRSSTSVDAVLKDFVAGAFESCGASISIAGTATNEVNAPHTFTVTVTKTVAGTQTGVSGVVPTVTLTGSNGATITNANTSDCDDGTNSSGVCLVTFSSTTAGVVTGHASANVVIGATTFPVQTNGLAGNSGDAVKTFVDAQIALSPLTDTNGIGESHTVTVSVDKNVGDNAGFVDAAGEHVSFTAVDSLGASVAVDAIASTCDNVGPNTSTTGTCTIVFTSASAGLVTVNASVSLTVGGVTMTRDTNPTTVAIGAGPGGTGPATKRFVDARIKLSPLTATNAVGQAHTVTVTVEQDLGTGSGFVAALTGDVDFTATGAAVIVDNTASTCDDVGADNLDAAGTCTIVFTSPTAGTVTINASVALSVSGESITRDTDPSTAVTAGPSGTGPATKVFVDARIKLSPLTATNEVGAAHTVTVTVEQNLGAGGGFVVAPTGDVDFTATNSNGSAVVVDNTASSCDDAGADNLDANGQCTIVFTSPSSGVVTINASVTLSVSGQTITRDTDPNTAATAGAGGTGPASKTFVDASIALSPLTATNAVGQAHTVTVTVKQNAGDGAGFVAAPTGHVTFTLSDAFGSAAAANNTASTCDDAGDNLTDLGTCTIVFTSVSAGQVTINASVTLTVVSESLTRDTDPATASIGAGPDGTGAASKVFVDARILLSPLTATNAIGEAHTVTVSVDQNLGLGGGFVDAPDGHVTFTPTDTLGAVSVLNAALTTCDEVGDNLDANGQCVIVFTSNSAGKVTINASVTLLVSGQSITRDTDPATAAVGAGPGGTGPATKDFISGILKWLKFGPDGTTPLGGAIFEVCRTHTFNTATGQFDDTTDVCVGTGSPARIADDVSAPGGTGANADNDAAPGVFQLSSLVLGRYTIQEKVAPTGYALDTDTETVEITTSNPSNADGTTGDVIPSFVDPQLFRIIVITCNDSDDTLVDSTVVIDGVTYQTITTPPAGLTQAETCNIGGATKGDLPANPNISISVELPDRAPFFTPF